MASEHSPLRAASLAGLISLFLLCAALAAWPSVAEGAPPQTDLAGQDAVRHVVGEAGTSIVSDPGSPTAGDPPARDTYLWRSTHANWIGTSTGISSIRAADDVIVGHGNAPPTELEVFAAEGQGTPYWTEPAGEAQVAARDGVLAAADFVNGYGITLKAWVPDPATPAWTYPLPGCSFGDESNTLQVDMNGTRVCLGCFYQNQVRLVVLEAATGAALVDAIIPLDPPSCRGLSCSDDGRFVVLNCGATHVVYDVDLDAERARISTGASTRPTGISETGEWVAAGFTTCKAYQWDPGTQGYVLRWSRSTPSHYLSVNMISERGYWIVGWYSTSYNQNRFQRWDLATGQPVWTLDLPTSPGAVQDLPVSVDYSADRSVIAFGCWGDTYEISPEILVIDPDGEELASLHAPGSIFDVSVSPNGRFVSGTGKLVHANIYGSGSDAYCLYSGDPSAVAEIVPADAGLRIFPNPCYGTATILASGPRAAQAPVRILDSTGRLVRTLPLSAGASRWTGVDESGAAVPAGVYYAAHGAPGEAAKTRVVLLR